MKLLMHICCSNCAIYPLENFLSKGIDVKGLWFNPNIHPYTEYSNRLDSLRKLQKLWNFDIEYVDEYALDDFLKSIVNQGRNRCLFCYSIRLDKAAESAKKMNLGGFTTSLLASPYQKFDMILEIGEAAGKRHGIPFFAEDVRQGWGISRALSTELGLYRQKYCGCIYSEMERNLTKSRKKSTAFGSQNG
jgi:predicted adenine nucleotide alpha hydrolase (AANH) superfamily ATPase